MRWGEGGIPIRLRRSVPWTQLGPAWQDAKPKLIEAALKRAHTRPSGNWYVLAASTEVRGDRPTGRTIAGVEVVAWRTPDGRLHAGPGECPHLGAPLCRAAVHGGALVCRWHGLSLGERGAAGWEPFPAHDDGVLAWVRLDAAGGEQPLDAPVLAARPDDAASVDAVMTLTGRCEPEDVIANRLDPWHGAWFHPYSFVDLRVVETPPDDGDAATDRFLVEVSFRISGRVVVPVLAAFSCPEPRTVVMHILDGEGASSVVETHAVPVGADDAGHPRTAVIEATIAHSDRKGFAIARTAAPVMRPMMRMAARRLWRDDLAYAERRYELRTTGRWPG